MKAMMIVTGLLLLLLGLWGLLSAVLLGWVAVGWLPLSLPTTTAELGDSIGMLNGLFSSLTVLAALLTVVLQGRALKASTDAQNQQAAALHKQLAAQGKINEQQLIRSQMMLEQLRQQQLANEVIILQAQQQYHAAEIGRMDAVLSQIDGKREKSDLFERCVAKKKEHIVELGAIHEKIKEMRR